MEGEAQERWIRLCRQASTEQDSEKLIELIREINDLLEEKRARLHKEAATENLSEVTTAKNSN